MKKLTNEQPFLFRQFAVHHHLCAHKVGFDGVLLGAWAHTAGHRQVLDIGTGSGLMALMTAQRNAQAHVTGIEIHAASAAQARQNFAASPWAERLRLTEADFLLHDFEQDFDHLITNPPFYLGRVKASGEARNNARHFSPGQLSLFIDRTTSLLRPGGSFSLIIPFREWQGFRHVLLDAGFWIKRACTVYTRNNTPERLLLECSTLACEKEETRLNIYDNSGKYSAEYTKLTDPFYL